MQSTSSRVHRRAIALALAVVSVGVSRSSIAADLASTLSLTTLPNVGASMAYTAVDTNSCAVSRNIASSGNYEFASFYDTSGNIYVSRRTLGSSTWQTVSSGLSISSSLLSDDHNVISLGIDGGGYLHFSYGLHNADLTYARTATPVTSGSWTSNLAMSTTVTMPTADADAATYPEFYNIRKSDGTYSGDLQLVYRNGYVGGGSGNGNTYINSYNTATQTWTHNATPIFGGKDAADSPYKSTYGAGYNAYNNRFVYTSTGKLVTTLTWRETPDYQSNHEIVYSESLNNGATWLNGSGSYVSTITQSNDKVAKSIAPNNSLINQTSTAVDKNGNVLVGTWWARWNSSVSKYNRQYELGCYNPSNGNWTDLQLTSRTSDASGATAIDVNKVREMGRPIVLTDGDRTLTVMRYSDTAQGVNDDIRVMYSSAADKYTNLSSWNTLVLSTEPMGDWEPTYDEQLWESKHILSLLYQPINPTSMSGSSITDPESGHVQVLNWDEGAYFAVPEPASLGLGLPAGWLLLRRRTRAAKA